MYRHFRSKVAVVQEGVESLPRCDFCGIHIPVGWLIKHHRTSTCDKNTHMWWYRRDVAIVYRCSEATFILTGEEDVKCIEGVEVFKYPRWPMERSDDKWSAVLRNISNARKVWGELRKMLWREGT